jgi:hypothetical protein
VTTLGLGRHADGGGLYLRVTPNGARSWVYMTARNGKRTEIGLGAASTVSLGAARQLAGKMPASFAYSVSFKRLETRSRPVAATDVLPLFSSTHK